MKRLYSCLFVFLFVGGIIGCAGSQQLKSSEPVQAEVKITIVQEGDAVAITAESGDEQVGRMMEIGNPGLQLSQLSKISNQKMFVKIFSGISVADVTRLWNDLIYLENETLIKDVQLFIDSPGGDAFSGLALADQIEKYQKKGFKFTAHATGIVASAAVPVFAVCDETHATSGTVFMVHEAALWKWPGRETASDIRTQGKLMDLLQKLYIDKLVKNSKLNFKQWVHLESATSWFGVKTIGDVTGAMEIGILDYID